VVEGVDDWNDLRYILCNKAHSQFVIEEGEIVGKTLRELKDIDERSINAFIAVCKGRLVVLSDFNLNQIEQFKTGNQITSEHCYTVIKDDSISFS
jgi:hypothetical protein